MVVSNDNVSDMLERVMSRVPKPAEFRDNTRKAWAVRTLEAARSTDPEWRLQGILAQTSVTTNFGKVPAQLIRVGDRVRTRNGRYMPVMDIHEYKLDLEYVERHAEALPVLIPTGAIDGRHPTQDVLLSPEQLVTCDGKHALPDMIRARDIPRSRRTVDPTLGLVAYFKFELEEPTEIYCEGIWVKSAVSRKGA